MKIGKQHKRFGGPSQKFLDRKAAEGEAKASAAPADGRVKLFLDDERPAPKGWTLARNGARFRELLAETAGRVCEISLDWHLRDGERGNETAQHLAGLLVADPDAFPALEYVFCHSTDHDEARRMARTIEKAVPEGRRDDLIVLIGSPGEG